MLKGLVYLVLALIAAAVFPTGSYALTRVPTPGTGESSLLYWRYLCRGQPQAQSETKAGREPQNHSETKARRELSCPSQRWKVRTHPGQDRVMEVVEDAS